MKLIKQIYKNSETKEIIKIMKKVFLLKKVLNSLYSNQFQNAWF